MFVFLCMQGEIGSSGDDLITDLENALSKQRPYCASGFKLEKARESRYQSQIRHRLNELKGQLFN